MTKKQRLMLGSTVIICVLAITLGVFAKDTQPKENNKSIGQLMNEMDGLRDLKQECSDNLNTIDTAHFLRSEPGYCDSWDNEIAELRNQISELGKKDYERARELGLR